MNFPRNAAVRGRTGLRGWTAALAGALLCLAAAAGADEGLKGHVSFEGRLLPGVSVRVYPLRSGGFGPLTGDKPLATAQTSADGSYRLALPPGSYVVDALMAGKGAKGPRPEPGDLYALHSGSPVAVAAGRWATAVLPLATIPAETRAPSKESKIKGRLTYQGKPLGKAYLYVFKRASGDFRTMPDVLQPVGDGGFTLRLAPGTYTLLARKRQRGGPYGPIEKGDLVNFYPLNPVVVEPGVEVGIEIPLLEKHEEGEVTATGLRVRVVDAAGKPLAGRYVLAYAQAARTGPPETASAPTDARGEAVLALPPGAPYLRARGQLGGPVGEDEPFADLTVPDKPPAVLVIRLGTGP